MGAHVSTGRAKVSRDKQQDPEEEHPVRFPTCWAEFNQASELGVLLKEVARDMRRILDRGATASLGDICVHYAVPWGFSVKEVNVKLRHGRLLGLWDSHTDFVHISLPVGDTSGALLLRAKITFRNAVTTYRYVDERGIRYAMRLFHVFEMTSEHLHVHATIRITPSELNDAAEPHCVKLDHTNCSITLEGISFNVPSGNVQPLWHAMKPFSSARLRRGMVANIMREVQAALTEKLQAGVQHLRCHPALHHAVRVAVQELTLGRESPGGLAIKFVDNGCEACCMARLFCCEPNCPQALEFVGEPGVCEKSPVKRVTFKEDDE